MPVVDQLPCPQLESEAKHTSVKVMKQTVAPVVEGTSVAPRQRPKGGQPLSVGGVLPLPLGSSPVPMAASARRQTAPNALPSLSQSPVPVNGALVAASESLPVPVTTAASGTSCGSSSHQPPPHPPAMQQVTPVQTLFPSPVSATVSFDTRLAGNPSSSHSSVPAVSVQGHTTNITTVPVKSSEDSRESLEALFPASGKGTGRFKIGLPCCWLM